VEYVKDAVRLVASREMHVCATFARRFYWSDLNLWPEDLAPGSVVLLSGKVCVLEGLQRRCSSGRHAAVIHGLQPMKHHLIPATTNAVCSVAGAQSWRHPTAEAAASPRRDGDFSFAFVGFNACLCAVRCVQDDLMDAAEVKDMLDVAGHVKVRVGKQEPQTADMPPGPPPQHHTVIAAMVIWIILASFGLHGLSLVHIVPGPGLWIEPACISMKHRLHQCAKCAAQGFAVASLQ